MKHHLYSLSLLLLASTLCSCVVETSTAPVVVSGSSSGWEGAAASAYIGGVTTGFVGSSYYRAPYYRASYYRAPYYRSSYYAPVRGYYGGYRHVGNINGGINRIGRR